MIQKSDDVGKGLLYHQKLTTSHNFLVDEEGNFWRILFQIMNASAFVVGHDIIKNEKKRKEKDWQ